MWEESFNEFVTLFVILNPLGTLPVFLAVTAGMTTASRRKVALVATLVSFIVLVLFVVAGGFLLEQMGIALRSFQISGGIVLFVFALGMIRGETFEPAKPGAMDNAVALAIYPVAIPKIAGPGAMLTVVLLTDDDRFNLVEEARTVAIIAIVLVITLGILLAAEPVSRLVGRSGASVIGRIMGVILASLAVNMVLTALAEWLNLPPP